MTKDVLLSIKGLQIGENEQNDTIEAVSYTHLTLPTIA